MLLDKDSWLRLDIEDEELWLGMLQVKPLYHRQGVGKYILSVVENIAKEKGIQRIGIRNCPMKKKSTYITRKCISEVKE